MLGFAHIGPSIHKARLSAEYKESQDSSCSLHLSTVSAHVLFWSVHLFLFLCSEQYLCCSVLSFVDLSHGLLSNPCMVAYFLSAFYLQSLVLEWVKRPSSDHDLSTLGGAFLLRVVCVSLQGENQESGKLENK